MLAQTNLRQKLLLSHVRQRIFHLDPVRSLIPLEDEVEVVLSVCPLGAAEFSHVLATHHELFPRKAAKNHVLAIQTNRLAHPRAAIRLNKLHDPPRISPVIAMPPMPHEFDAASTRELPRFGQK